MVVYLRKSRLPLIQRWYSFPILFTEWIDTGIQVNWTFSFLGKKNLHRRVCCHQSDQTRAWRWLQRGSTRDPYDERLPASKYCCLLWKLFT